jgi:hypothetical protein
MVTNRTKAGVTLAFASELPSDDDLLKHVAALANAEGGDLLIGIRTRTDSKGERPIAAVGVPVANVDLTTSALALTLRRLQPNVPDVTITAVGTYIRGPVVAIRVPASDSAPHNAGGVFWVRRMSDIERMTDPEVRAAREYRVHQRAQLSEYLRSRVAEIRAGQTPVSLRRAPLLLVHLVPRDALRHSAPVRHLSTYQERALRPIRSFEGRMLPQPHDFVRIESARAYTMLGRNGVIEAVAVTPHSARLKQIHERSLANHFRAAVRRYVALQDQVGASLPIHLSLMLADAGGYRLGVGGAEVSTDLVGLDPVPIHGDPTAALQTTLDWLWQAAGYARCAVAESRKSR